MERKQQCEELGRELYQKGIEPEDICGCVADTFGNSMTADDMIWTARAWLAQKEIVDLTDPRD
jgi:hypothetical protein